MLGNHQVLESKFRNVRVCAGVGGWKGGAISKGIFFHFSRIQNVILKCNICDIHNLDFGKQKSSRL